eukprot:2686475-Rhodomonas_salina.4
MKRTKGAPAALHALWCAHDGERSQRKGTSRRVPDQQNSLSGAEEGGEEEGKRGRERGLNTFRGRRRRESNPVGASARGRRQQQARRWKESAGKKYPSEVPCSPPHSATDIRRSDEGQLPHLLSCTFRTVDGSLGNCAAHAVGFSSSSSKGSALVNCRASSEKTAGKSSTEDGEQDCGPLRRGNPLASF